MDHKLAESLQLAEKYTLNELSAEERKRYEEHLFDCSICSEHVRQTFTTLENLKQVLAEERVVEAQQKSIVRPAWWEWLRLPSLIPTFVALALAGIVLHQNTNPSHNEVAQVLTSESVVAPVSRGERQVIRVDRKSPMFLLTFNVDSSRPDSFFCEFDDARGKHVLTVKSEPQATAAFNLPVLLPVTSFPAGRYQMRLHPASEPDSITTYPFIVEDRK